MSSLQGQAAKSFERHPQYLKAVAESAQPLCQQFLSLHFDAQVPAELEDMFRRGPEWEGGVEHILVMEVTTFCIH